MNRNDIERAWPAVEPPPGFSERVLAQAREQGLPDPAPARASAVRRLETPRLRWLALPVAALCVAAALLLLPARPAREGEVIAAEPRVVAIGERAVAELSRGAQLRWAGDEVQQTSGAVTYRVQPGASFRVTTPHGSVAVLGTVFRVVVAEAEERGGESMDKRWVLAGAGAVLGVLLWVSVDEGSVRLSQGEEELVLHSGQAGAIGADGSPRLQAAALGTVAAAKVATQKGDDERARARQVADAVRKHAARRREAARAAGGDATLTRERSGSTTGTPPVDYQLPTTPGVRPTLPPMPEEEARRREYLRRAIVEQYFPAARDCYGELLGRQPTAGGKVVLEFAIVGDGDAGVVDRVALREDESTLDDPEFALCMRESMYTAVFEAPPPGASETTVVYPIELRPE